MDRFAFLIHPMEIKQIYPWQPWLKFVPSRLTEKILERSNPFKASHVTNICSKTGKKVEGYLIACPLLPHQIVGLKEEFVLSKIAAAGELAENFGAKILGLGAYTSVVGHKGVTIARKLNMAVTTGNSLTVAMVIEGIHRAAAIRNLDLSRSTVAMIGATGSIGSACTRILAQHIPHFVINARCEEKLKKLAFRIRKEYSSLVNVETDPVKAVSGADIVVTASSATQPLIHINDLKNEAIACDVALPNNIQLENMPNRTDTLVFKGGLVKTPSEVSLGMDIGLPSGVVYACMAETMILALEGIFKDYSIGETLSMGNIEEIKFLSRKHGFEVFGIDEASHSQQNW